MSNKTLQAVVVVLGTYALLHVTIQSFRHVYVLLIEPRTSVLDKFNPLEQDIASVATLQELEGRYEEAHKRLKKWEAANTKLGFADPGREEEPYRSEDLLRVAIET